MTQPTDESKAASSTESLANEIEWQTPRQLKEIAIAVFFVGMFTMMNVAPMLPPEMQNPPPALYRFTAFGAVVCTLLLTVPALLRFYFSGSLRVDVGQRLVCKQPRALRDRFHTLSMPIAGPRELLSDQENRYKGWGIDLSEIDRFTVSFGQQSALWNHIRPARIDIVRKGFEYPTKTAYIGTGEDAERVCEWLHQHIASAGTANEATTSDP